MKDKILRIERIGGEDYEVVENRWGPSSCRMCEKSAACRDSVISWLPLCSGGYLRKVKDAVTVSQEAEPADIDWTGLFRKAVVFFQGFLFALVCTQDREFAAYAALVLAAVTAAKLMGDRKDA